MAHETLSDEPRRVDDAAIDPAAPPGVHAAWRVATHTGSVYPILLDRGGQWWLGGVNVPNPISCALPPGHCWRIRPPEPWPPVLGERLLMRAPADMNLDDPERIPGGGKVTSPVASIGPLWAGSAPPVPSDDVP